MYEVSDEPASCVRAGTEINSYVLRNAPCPKEAAGVGLSIETKVFW